MYVCLCKGITDRQLRAAACEGIHDLRSACRVLGVGSECGQCTQQAREVLQQTLQSAASHRAEIA